MDERVLNELLECSVCLDRLELSSKVLPCQHTFCRRCLEEIVSTKQELRCPECRSLVEIPIEDLPPNILLIRLLEGMKHAGRIAASVALSNQGNSGGGRVSIAPTHATAGAGCHVRAARCSPKTISTSQPRAKAIYNYDAKEPGDLSFCKGDVVLLKKQVDENWYHGELNGHQGFFPATYVQVITPLAQEIPKCKALYDFVVTDSKEKDCLIFHRDDELTVIRRVDDNWAEGKLADRIGIFPISFVEMNDAAKWLVNAHFNQSNQAGSSRAAPATCSALTSQCLAAPIATTAPTFAPPGATKTVAPPSNPNVLLTQQVSQQKRHSMTALSSSPHRSTAPEHHRHSMEIPSGHDAIMAAIAGADGIAVTVAPRTISKVSIVTSSDNQTRTSASGVSCTTAPPTFYVALYNYKPQKTDEVELRKGDYYTVTEKCQDGWFKGTCLRSGSVGVFPGNYVQAVKINSSSKPSVTMATVTTVGGATGVSTSSAGNGSVTSVSHSTPSSMQSNGGRAPVVPSHVPVGRTHSFPKTSPRATLSASTLGQCVTKMPNVTVTHTRTITNVTQAVTRSLMSASQQSRPITHGGDITGVTTVSHVSTKHSDVSGNGDKNRGRGSPHVSCRPAEKVTKHSTASSSSTSANHHHHHHQGQGHSASAAALSSAHHSMSTSVVVTPPNVIVGATSSSNHVVTTTTSKDKDKKEKREKDVMRLGIMKRLTKTKKSKSPPPEPATDDIAGHPPVPHQRSGSLLVDSPGGATAGISALQSKKSDTSHQQAPSPSSSSSRPGKPKPLVRERYRCIVPYPPQSDIELELKVGDIVYIHKKREDGWFKGTQQRTGKTGLFPGSFVKSF